MKIKISRLRKLMQGILTRTHFSALQAKEITDVLLYAEMSGKTTQGIIKFPGNEPMQNIIPENSPKIIKDTKLSTFIDGGRNPGMLVSRIATRLAIKKSKKSGIGIIGVNNTYSSTGALGFYANEIAKKDLIGIIMSGSPKGVTPHGSIDKLMGINPIAFGFPTLNAPLIFDMATAAITWYGLVKAKIMGEDIPAGMAIDVNGKPTKDPEKAMKGAVLTFGDNRKMSGLSMMIEMFTGPLLGVIAPEFNGKWYTGSLFIAIDPNLFIGRQKLKIHVSELMNKVKKSRSSKIFKEVLLPGEQSLKARSEAESKGEVQIEDNVFSDFMKLVTF